MVDHPSPPTPQNGQQTHRPIPPPAPRQAFIGPPSEHARYEVLRSAVIELGRAGIIGDLPPSRQLPHYQDVKGAGAASLGGGSSGAAAAGGQQQGDGGEVVMSDGGAAASAAALANGGASSDPDSESLQALGRLLCAAAAEADGFSGRALRKLPFLAHAAGTGLATPCGCAEFLRALQAAVARERADRSELTTG